MAGRRAGCDPARNLMTIDPFTPHILIMDDDPDFGFLLESRAAPDALQRGGQPVVEAWIAGC